MATIKKLNICVYSNLCLSICQILNTSANTFLALSFHFMNAKPDGSHRTSHILPTLMLVVAVLVLYVNLGQIIAARKLVKERRNVSIVYNIVNLKTVLYTSFVKIEISYL